ncbi:MAG: hypothetical protein HN719_13640 [Alphaproteobacteria bacterium]|nr:hypothetical protein [Alphaproteobacteria bacterium]
MGSGIGMKPGWNASGNIVGRNPNSIWGTNLMKRMTVIFFVAILVCTFLGMDLVIARTHRDAPLGGFSLWQIFIGVIFLVVMFSIFAGGGESESQAVRDLSKKAKERDEREKKEKGLLRYYAENVGWFFALALCLPLLAIVLGIINWLFS